jgi:hypothetical protein
MREPGLCKECGCTTGGGEYCYRHAPYMVWPKADGSFLSDRNGRKHVSSFDEPPMPDPSVPWSAIRALVQQWKDPEFWKEHGSLMDSIDCADQLAALCPPAPTEESR